MKNFVKVIALFLAFVTCLAFVGCNDKKITELGIYDGNKQIADSSDMILNINGNALNLKSYAYFYFNELKDWQSDKEFSDSLTYGEYFAGLTAEEKTDVLLGRTLSNISEFYAKEALFEQYGIEITDEIKEAVEAEMEALLKKYGTQSDLEYALSNVIFTDEEHYKTILAHHAREAKLIEALYHDEIFEHARSNFYYVEQIAITYNEGDAAAEALASSNMKQALARYENGAEFLTLATEYNNGSESYDAGILCISKENTLVFDGSSVSEGFAKIAMALGEGEVSDIMYIDGAYRIFKRVEMSDNYITSNISAFTSDETYQRYNELVDSEAGKVKFELRELYSSINYDSLLHPSPFIEREEQ